jgi:SAM-dependent methyltransferase
VGTEGHADVVRREFTRQAPTFTADGWAAAGLDWIIEQVRPAADEHALEVAAGAAHLGRALAPHVAHVTAIDLTPAVLEQGKARAEADGLRHLLFEVGDAAHLPYLDASFDVVVCRLAVHHFPQPGLEVAEMLRVCRPSGRVVLVDMIADNATGEMRDALERLRDPSHTRTLTIEELSELLVIAGGSITTSQIRANPLQLADWLDRTQTPQQARAEIITALESELDGGPSTGLRPHRRDGELWLTHEWVALTAIANRAGPGEPPLG